MVTQRNFSCLQIDGVGPFPWIVKPCKNFIQPSENIYKNLSLPRGLVIIFNYYFSGRNYRKGAEVDSHNLKTLFTNMGYRVKLHEDLTRDRTLEELKNIQQDRDLTHYDSFILILLSHGEEDAVFFTAGGNAKETMNVDDVRYRFLDGQCPYLKNKPKIFLFNFCRGQNQESRSLKYDSMGPNSAEAPRDMMTIYASIKTFRAMRDSGKGTVFVQALCEVLSEHAHDTELHDLYLKLCQKMETLEGTTPEEQNYRFKRFFFNPVPM